MLPIVLGITGASGAVYAARLLQLLLARNIVVHVAISESGSAVARQELGVELTTTPESIREFMIASDTFLGLPTDSPLSQAALSGADSENLQLHSKDNYFTPIASGSFLTRGMVICPCSGSTLSGVARSASANLIQRAAEVHLKEQRKLILVPRETPLSVLQLENMLRLAQAGCVILPAAPGWYHNATALVDLVDFVVARILDQLGVRNDQILRWSDGSESRRS